MVVRGNTCPSGVSPGWKDYILLSSIAPQASPKRQWNVDKWVEGGPGASHCAVTSWFTNYIPGTWSWGHRKGKRMLAFSGGGMKSKAPAALEGGAELVLCLFLTFSFQCCLVSFPSSCQNSPHSAKPYSTSEPLPQSSLLLSHTIYLLHVTFLWGPALCPGGWLINWSLWYAQGQSPLPLVIHLKFIG